MLLAEDELNCVLATHTDFNSDLAPAVVWMAGYDLLTEDCYVFLGGAECEALF